MDTKKKVSDLSVEEMCDFVEHYHDIIMGDLMTDQRFMKIIKLEPNKYKDIIVMDFMKLQAIAHVCGMASFHNSNAISGMVDDREKTH